jgi:hypothetical protein
MKRKKKEKKKGKKTLTSVGADILLFSRPGTIQS